MLIVNETGDYVVNAKYIRSMRVEKYISNHVPVEYRICVRYVGSGEAIIATYHSEDFAIHVLKELTKAMATADKLDRFYMPGECEAAKEDEA